MPRNNYTTAIINGIAEKDARPIWLVEMGFSAPVRISSRGDFTYSGNSFSGVSAFRLSLSGDYLTGSLSWFNQDFTYSQPFIDEGTAGVTCQAWMTYMEETDLSTADVVDGDFVLMFDGELGAARIQGRRIEVDLAQADMIWSPRQVIAAPVCNHIPLDGTEVRGLNGIKVLRRAR